MGHALFSGEEISLSESSTGKSSLSVSLCFVTLHVQNNYLLLLTYNENAFCIMLCSLNKSILLLLLHSCELKEHCQQHNG